MSNVILESVIEHNRQWRRNNLDMLLCVVAYLLRKDDWSAMIELSRYGTSEKQRMLRWEQYKQDFHLSNPEQDPMDEEELALILSIEELQKDQPLIVLKSNRRRGTS